MLLSWKDLCKAICWYVGSWYPLDQKSFRLNLLSEPRWRISTCLSFVRSCGVSLVSSPTVWLLSHSIVISCSRSNLMSLKKRDHQELSFAAVVSASNSASVVDVITVLCFVAFQSTGPPKRVGTSSLPSFSYLGCLRTPHRLQLSTPWTVR
jgi:hypothetical protein